MIIVDQPRLGYLGDAGSSESNTLYYVLGAAALLGGIWIFSDLGGREVYRQARYGKASGYKGKRYRRDLEQRQARLRKDVARIRKDRSLTAAERKKSIAQVKREYRDLDIDVRRVRRRRATEKRWLEAGGG